MDPVESMQNTARELVAYASRETVDLKLVLNDFMFQIEGRWIFLWRKLDALLCSGPDGEIEGTLHYNMQGRIKSLPAAFGGSSAAFQGMWSESGVVESIADAYALVKAWVLDAVEVDDLPQRRVLQHGIG
jgi:hypothetical protein